MKLGYVTEDGGESFRIFKVKYNTNYDYASDPSKKDRVYAASGNRHDFSLNINTLLKGEGGIFVSEDCGHQWKRPKDVDEKYTLSNFPSAFAVDFSRTKRDVMWLTDMENKGAWFAIDPSNSQTLITTDGGASWKKNEKLLLQANLFNVTLDPKNPKKAFYLFFGGGMQHWPPK